MHPKLKSWLIPNWNKLVQGDHLSFPFYRPHPIILGFSETILAENVGQLKDWVYQLEDGSRLHIHEFSDCLKIHIDKFSPEQGVLSAIEHWLLESKSAKVILAGGAIAIGVWYYFSRKNKNEV